MSSPYLRQMTRADPSEDLRFPRMTRHLTFANLASGLALVVALGTGASYAAEKVHLPKNSVSAKQIKTSAVRGAEIKDGAVTGTDVADGSLTAADLDPGTVAAFGGSVRAYGVVESNGTLQAARSKGATVAPSTFAGSYCVTPTPSSGIDVTKTPIMLTVDNNGANNQHLVQTVIGDVSTCPGGYLVYTSHEQAGSFTFSQVKFSFLIP